MPEKINWEYLIEKFAEDKCSKEELDQLLKFVAEDPGRTELTEALRNHWIASGQKTKGSGINWEEKLNTILNEPKDETPVISLLKKPKVILYHPTWPYPIAMLITRSVFCRKAR